MARSGNSFMSEFLYTYIETEQIRQDTIGNYSIVRVSVYLQRTNNNTTTRSWSISGNINGNGVSGSWSGSVSSNPVLIYRTGEIKIPHNNDGTKTFSTSFSLSCDKYNGSVSVNTTLTTIPRTSSFTLTKDTVILNGTDSTTINISRHSTEFKHHAYIRFGNYEERILIGEEQNIDETVNFKPSQTSINEFLQQIPNEKRGYGTITVYTLHNGNIVGTAYKTIYLEVDQDNHKPTINPDLDIKKWITKMTNPDGTLIQQDWLIQNVGFLTIKASGISSRGYSTLTSVYLTYGNTRVNVKDKLNGGSFEYQTPEITTSGDIPIKIEVIDSRGLSNSVETEVEIKPYQLPTISNFSVIRCDSEQNENDEEYYISINFDAEYSRIEYLPTSNGGNTATNTLSVKVYRKMSDWDDYILSRGTFSTDDTDGTQINNGDRYKVAIKDIVPKFSQAQGGHGWESNNEDEGIYFSTDNEYSIKLVIKDKLGSTAETYFNLGTATTILDLYQDGTGLAIGKVAQSSGLEIDWDTRINKTLTVGGNQVVGFTESISNDNENYEIIRKYSNGIMEIEGFYKITSGFSQDNIWTDWLSAELYPPDFTEKFKYTPVVIKNVVDGAGCFSIYRGPSDTNPGSVQILRPANRPSAGGTFTLHIIAKGEYDN